MKFSKIPPSLNFTMMLENGFLYKERVEWICVGYLLVICGMLLVKFNEYSKYRCYKKHVTKVLIFIKNNLSNSATF